MKKSMVGIILLLILIQFSSVACGETVSVNSAGILNRSLSIDPAGRSEGFSAVLYNNANGLPTSEANAIAETPDGFIWIGGYSGLTRYDGNQFKRYDSTTGINSVVSLFVDSKNRLWIGKGRAHILRSGRGT